MSTISYCDKKLAFQQELEELLQLDQESVTGGNKKVRRMHKRYAWLDMNTWDGRPLNWSDYQERLLGLLRDRQMLEEQVSTLDRNIKQAEHKLEEVNDKDLVEFLRTVQELIFLKTERIDVYTESFYLVLGLFDEISGRLGLSHDELMKLIPVEVEMLLEGESISKEELKIRDKYSVARVDDKVHYYQGAAVDVLAEVLSGQDYSKMTEFKGTVGYKGKVQGIAKVLKTDRELDKLEEGDIMVANLTNPNYNPAFEKVAAVVTDEGGVLCHSAIMAREFRIPCIIGTKIATRALMDGDKIEVDADGGVVRILERTDNTNNG